MDIQIEIPTRMCIIGASSTGKSELVKKMILRGVFGTKKELEIYIYATTQITLNQVCWKSLEKKYKISVKFVYLDKNTKPPPDPICNVKRLIIFDDLDYVSHLPKWIIERFTIASHHLNESVICISHRLKIGVVEVRTSALWIVLTAAPNSMLRETCKNLGCDYTTILRFLSDKKGIVESSPGQFKSYNSIFINQSFTLDEDKTKYYQLNDLTSLKTLSPLF